MLDSPCLAGVRARADDGAVTDPAGTEQLLAEQIAYYRRRAGEYDRTAYGDPDAVRPRIERILARLAPTGRLLELACGTGVWTAALAEHAASVLAVDSAPEAVAIARERVRSPRVEFEVADVFAFTTDRRFDSIFFSAWLSHVPADRFDEFWRLLRGLLAGGGRVLFLDEHVDERAKESYLDDAGEVVTRRLDDGAEFRIVKNFVDPAVLTARLSGLGWRCEVQRDGTDWVYGQARPVCRQSR